MDCIDFSIEAIPVHYRFISQYAWSMPGFEQYKVLQLLHHIRNRSFSRPEFEVRVGHVRAEPFNLKDFVCPAFWHPTTHRRTDFPNLPMEHLLRHSVPIGTVGRGNLRYVPVPRHSDGIPKLATLAARRVDISRIKKGSVPDEIENIIFRAQVPGMYIYWHSAPCEGRRLYFSMTPEPIVEVHFQLSRGDKCDCIIEHEFHLRHHTNWWAPSFEPRQICWANPLYNGYVYLGLICVPREAAQFYMMSGYIHPYHVDLIDVDFNVHALEYDMNNLGTRFEHWEGDMIDDEFEYAVDRVPGMTEAAEEDVRRAHIAMRGTRNLGVPKGIIDYSDSD
jgi:hypothetical protein